MVIKLKFKSVLLDQVAKVFSILKNSCKNLKSHTKNQTTFSSLEKTFKEFFKARALPQSFPIGGPSLRSDAN